MLFIIILSRVTLADAVPIVDTLGAATDTTQFSVFGSGGASIFSEQLAGPQFTLSDNTVLTEIGAFLNSTVPLSVQIRPSTSGVPDPTTILAIFGLSHDDNPLIVSFESVAINLPLPAGMYFALFAPGNQSDQGVLLGGATDPFDYVAGSITLGFLNPASGVSSTSVSFAAVRISGVSQVPGPPSSLLFGVALVGCIVIAWARNSGSPAKTAPRASHCVGKR